MEIILNLAWIFLAAVIMWLWLRYAPCEGASRRTQVAALAMLIVILFPVISVTDDPEPPSACCLIFRLPFIPQFESYSFQLSPCKPRRKGCV